MNRGYLHYENNMRRAGDHFVPGRGVRKDDAGEVVRTGD